MKIVSDSFPRASAKKYFGTNFDNSRCLQMSFRAKCLSLYFKKSGGMYLLTLRHCGDINIYGTITTKTVTLPTVSTVTNSY